MDIEPLLKEWASIPKPKGFVADITSKSEACHEYEDVESYFSGKNWDAVDPEHYDIRYMCPLLWMNEAAAAYYSLSFLTYLASEKAFKTGYEVPDMAVYYFESDSSILANLTESQRSQAKEIIDFYKKHQPENM